MSEDYNDDDYKTCPKCDGTGMVGECLPTSLGSPMFIDYECPKCKGRSVIQRKKSKKKGGER